jgi:cytoskeletal protein CcmA (bactofilin family)
MGKNKIVELSTIVGKDCIIEGNLKIKGGIRIDGTIKGNIETDGFVIIGQTGTVKANIKADECMVSGIVDGDVSVDKGLELDKNSRVAGNVSAKNLTVHNGAVLTGHCQMTQEPQSNVYPSFNEK